MTNKKASPGRTGITLKDVTKVSGVSPAAVSFALNGGGNLSSNSRERIRKIAAKVGYSPNRSAQATRTGRSQSIGLIVPDLRNPFYPELAQTLERRLEILASPLS